jgi:hypothetical protein
MQELKSPYLRRVNKQLSSFHPDEFMQLDLESYREIIDQYEPYYWLVIAPRYRREKDFTGYIVARDNIPGIQAVGFVLYDKLNRVLRA